MLYVPSVGMFPAAMKIKLLLPDGKVERSAILGDGSIRTIAANYIGIGEHAVDCESGPILDNQSAHIATHVVPVGNISSRAARSSNCCVTSNDTGAAIHLKCRQGVIAAQSQSSAIDFEQRNCWLLKYPR